MSSRVIAMLLGGAALCMLGLPRCTPQIPLPPPDEEPALQASRGADGRATAGAPADAGPATDAQPAQLDRGAPGEGQGAPGVDPAIGEPAAPPGGPATGR